MIGPLHAILGIALSESCYSLNNLTKREDILDVPQPLEEAGTGRPYNATGPVVPKEPDPAVEVATEAEMKKAPGCFDLRVLFYWLGGVRPGAGFTASMSSCGTSSNMR